MGNEKSIPWTKLMSSRRNLLVLSAILCLQSVVDGAGLTARLLADDDDDYRPPAPRISTCRKIKYLLTATTAAVYATAQLQARTSNFCTDQPLVGAVMLIPSDCNYTGCSSFEGEENLHTSCLNDDAGGWMQGECWRERRSPSGSPVYCSQIDSEEGADSYVVKTGESYPQKCINGRQMLRCSGRTYTSNPCEYLLKPNMRFNNCAANGSTCDLGCRVGFKLVGPQRALCDSEIKLKSPSVCAQTCGFWLNLGHSCRQGFKPNESRKDEPGQTEEVCCQPLGCEHPPPYKNLTVGECHDSGQACELGCLPGYHAVGNLFVFNSKCLNGFMLNNVNGSCKPDDCQKVSDDKQHVTLGNCSSKDEDCLMECEVGWKLKTGSLFVRKAHCDGGVLDASGVSGECAAESCAELDESLHMDLGNCKQSGDEDCDLKCKRGYTTIGSLHVGKVVCGQSKDSKDDAGGNSGEKTSLLRRRGQKAPLLNKIDGYCWADRCAHAPKENMVLNDCEKTGDTCDLDCAYGYNKTASLHIQTLHMGGKKGSVVVTKSSNQPYRLT